MPRPTSPFWHFVLFKRYELIRQGIYLDILEVQAICDDIWPTMDEAARRPFVNAHRAEREANRRLGKFFG